MAKEKSKKEKSKDKDRDRESGKDKSKKKKHSKHSRRESSSDESDGGAAGTAQQQLRRERAAVAALRGILSNHAPVKAELRGLLWSLDQGKAVSIAAIPDAALKASVQDLFTHLRLQFDATQGVHGKSSRSPAILSILGFVFEEAPRPPSAPKLAAAAAAAPPARGGAAAGPRPAVPEDERRGAQQSSAAGSPSTSGSSGSGDDVPRRSARGPQRPSQAEHAAHAPRREAAPCKAEPQDSHTTGSGAAALPPKAEPLKAEPAAAPAPPPRRTVGPAMPSAQLLAAAAAAGAEQARMEEEAAERERDDELLMVGPPPPELVEELDAVPANERDAEVQRIMRAVKDAIRAAADAASAGKAPALPSASAAGLSDADAYCVLGLEPSVAAADVKKRYMRLSLLIHPDKCKHPAAHEAFQALSRAAKLLQDAEQRGALDAAREEKELRRMAAEEAVKQERERQWRVARGEELAGAPGGGPQERQRWMMDLPPERVANTAEQQLKVTAFSRNGPRSRGDTSEWTDTPAIRAAREAQLLLQGGTAMGQLLALTGAAASAAGIGPGGLAAMVDADMLDSYNSNARPKTLLEKHLETQKAAAKAARKGTPAPAKQPAPAAAAAAAALSSGSSSGGEDSGRDGGRDGKDRKKRKKKHRGKKDKEERGSRKRSAAEAAGAQSASGGVAAAPAEGQEWVGKHPWRPFDRDTDLEIKPQHKSQRELMGAANNALGGMFSSGGTQRHFL